MVDGLPSKPYGSRLPQQSGARAGNTANTSPNGSNNAFSARVRNEVQEDQQQRHQELQRQYAAQTQEFQQDWDKIAGLEKRMDLIQNKLRQMKDPTRREQARDKYDKLKWKVNELYQGSLLTADNAFSTALTPGF